MYSTGMDHVDSVHTGQTDSTIRDTQDLRNHDIFKYETNLEPYAFDLIDLDI